MRHRLAKALSEALESLGHESEPTQIDSDAKGWTVSFPDLPTMLRCVASAMAEVGPTGSKQQDKFLEELAEVTTWDGIEGDRLLC